jgi:hypothetical protein
MKNFQRGFVVPLVIVVIAILAIGSVYVYKNKSSETSVNVADLNLEDSNTDSNTDSNKNTVSSTPQNTNQTVPVSRYDNELVNQCVSAYQFDQKKYNSYFSPGYIVVGFPTDTSLDSAKLIIKSHNLTPRETNVGYHSYLYADVTVGQEFLWSCRIKQDSRIRYAEPSPVSTIQ